MTSTFSTSAIPEEAAIAIDDLVVMYGRHRAVDGLTLHIPQGCVFGLLGPNGAGKTTTIKTLLGFRFPNSGSASILGYNITRQREEINAHLGFVSEINSLYYNMSISEIVAFCRTTARQWNQLLFQGYFAMFGLPTKAQVKQLSKGMRTQLALCLALGSEPELLILDEPMIGLDPIARLAFLKVLIEDLARVGRTVFFSTHILADIETVADRVGFMQSGKLVLSEDLDQLKQKYARVTITFGEPIGDDYLHTLRQIPGIKNIEWEGRTVQLLLVGEISTMVATLRTLGPSPLNLEVVNLSLEEIFICALQAREI